MTRAERIEAAARELAEVADEVAASDEQAVAELKKSGFDGAGEHPEFLALSVKLRKAIAALRAAKREKGRKRCRGQ